MARINTNLSTISLLIIAIVLFSDYTNSKPIQILNNKPGYIAVYIRHGNEPLQNINPALAEAFHEEIVENGVIPIEDHEDSIIENLSAGSKFKNLTDSTNDKDFFIPQTRPYVVQRS
ncbi:uncharacterized protein LOC103569682 [Microplitis demolitor]|uniref:uncharacterized protein LOC103569682 n=1 Tax=Microplitis demolitor TaxID=69319 RepID=UPI0004CCF053|nr:uncharacterized protein LOC103569682 [Microplitis demolitor]